MTGIVYGRVAGTGGASPKYAEIAVDAQGRLIASDGGGSSGLGALETRGVQLHGEEVQTTVIGGAGNRVIERVIVQARGSTQQPLLDPITVGNAVRIKITDESGVVFESYAIQLQAVFDSTEGVRYIQWVVDVPIGVQGSVACEVESTSERLDTVMSVWVRS